MKTNFILLDGTPESISKVEDLVNVFNKKFTDYKCEFSYCNNKDWDTNNHFDFGILTYEISDPKNSTSCASQFGNYIYVDIPERIYDTTFPHINFCVTEYYEEYIKNTQL
jgi:hypothetical protein